jgi:DNA-binding MarR family transcriptional regulator
MDNSFYDFTVNINKLNKLFLETIDLELKTKEIYDVTPMQALLILNIACDKKNINNLQSDYYIGKNTSYNTNNLAKRGYITRTIGKEDKRCVIVSLTDKGKELYDFLSRVLMSRLKVLQEREIDVMYINTILSELQIIF